MNRKIAIHQPILPDELLTSWILRYSQRLKTKYHTFCKFNFDGDDLDTRDIDLTIKDSQIKKLSEITFHSYEDIAGCTLQSFVPHLALESDINYWVLTQAATHRIPRNNFLVFCPSCLKKDSTPYFRKKWRLATSLYCESCSVELLDCCPSCEKPVSFLRLDFKDKENVVEGPICICYFCGFDLRKSRLRKVNTESLEYQTRVNGLIENGHLDSLNYSHQYFFVLRIMFKLLNTKRSHVKDFKSLVADLSGYSQNKNDDGVSCRIRNMTLERRKILLLKSYWLMSQPDDVFIDICKKTRMWSCFLTHDIESKDIPYWFFNLINSELSIKYFEWKRVYPNDSTLASYNAVGLKIKNNIKV